MPEINLEGVANYILCLNVFHNSKNLVIFIECDRAGWIRGTNVASAKHANRADGDFFAGQTSGDEEGKLSRHVAPRLKPEGGDEFLSIFIKVIVICCF